MAIHKTSDSHSTYDPYFEKFSTVARPARPLSPAEPGTETKDTLEISSAKLKEEAMSKLGLKEKYLIPQNSFMRIGKYLFLAVAFPPYFALIGLPKWILVEGIPLLLSWNQLLFAKISEKSRGPIESMVSKMREFVSFIQKLTSVLIMPIVNLGLEIKNQLKRFREVATTFVSKGLEKINQGLERPKKGIKQGLRFAALPFVLVENGMQKSFKRVKASIELLQESLIAVPHLMKEWGNLQFSQLFGVGLNFKEKVIFRFSKAHQWANRGADKLLASLENAFRAVKFLLTPFYQVYKRVVVNPVTSFFAFAKMYGLKVGEFLDQKKRQMAEFILRIQKKVGEINSKTMADRWIAHSRFAKLPARLQLFLKAIFRHRLFHLLFNLAIKASGYFLTAPAKGAHFFVSSSSRFLNKVSKFYVQGREFFLKQMKAVQTFSVATLLPFLGRLVWKGSYAFLLFLMMLLVLANWGWRLLAEASNQLSQKMTFRKKERSDL